MDINLLEITVRELADGFVDNAEKGVTGYGGRLNIRPAYQREYIYNNKQRDAVVDTVRKHFPLNVMYWARNNDGNFELLDGQQRTMSICMYVTNVFSIDDLSFHNLLPEEKKKILDYKLMIYVCDGTVDEKIEWFKTINIPGTQLTAQELRNAVLTGTWLSDAKLYFSKTNCAAGNIGRDYLTGSSLRQEYLETAIRWIADRDGIDAEDTVKAYMAAHQDDTNASDLWMYFKNVIDWVEIKFPVYRKEMKNVNWGFLYNRYGRENLDPDKLEKDIARLMMDDDVTKQSGIYDYVLSGNERSLNIRAFSPAMKRAAYERAHGRCAVCGKHFDFNEMEADHITPWCKGGKTTADNCQMLCKQDNRRKSGK